MKRLMKLIAVFALIVTTFAACTSSEDQDAKVNFRLTDAPGLYDSVNVEILDLEVHTEDGWESVIINPGIYNLLDFTNGKDTLIASSALEPGKITQIRLILGDDNYVVLTSGQAHQLTTPSGQQSGLKLLVNQELEPGLTYNFILDFDAEQSIVVTGNDKYILKPTIKVILADNSGSISGIVDPASSNSVVYAINGSDTSSTYPDGLGAFTVSGLAPADYDVAVVPTAGGYSDTTIADVTVTAGQDNNIGTIELQ